MEERQSSPKRGGFQRPVRLGTWIRDSLSGGMEIYALRLYGYYITEVKIRREEQEKVKGKKLGKPHYISYGGFRAYLYALRQLELIEYTGRKESAETIAGEPAPYLAERLYFRANLDRLDDAAWLDPMASYPRVE